ncbi:DUF3122 domain-containing protein [Leptolyngbya sp. AN03gr2]|uniref:DUF3122 domain-containing protein n=1 Tax=Leptolyngbya sp. AN10 TaxID=3423365 RepID=UPI003D31A9D0
MENSGLIVENLAQLWKSCVLAVLIWAIGTNIALASVHTYSDSNSVLFRSLSKLQDDRDRAWQVVFYKRFPLGQSDTIHVRLVGFPGLVKLDHDRPLEIEANRSLLSAKDVTPSDFSIAYVGEYDFKPVLNQLDTDTKLTLILPLDSGEARLKIPQETALEWWRVASWQPGNR